MKLRQEKMKKPSPIFASKIDRFDNRREKTPEPERS